MADKGWTVQTAAAAGIAAGTGAAQLGLGYGLGVVVWPATMTADDSVWLGSLGWATWIAASSTVLGAVIAGRMRRPVPAPAPVPHDEFDEPAASATVAPVLRPSGPWRLVLALAAAVGALVTVALIVLPARSAVRPDTYAPETVATGYALVGVALGLVVAYWAVWSRAVAANLIATTVWLWALAVAAVIVQLTTDRTSETYLTSWQFADLSQTARYGTIYWPSALLTVLAALLIGMIAVWPAVFRGDLGLGAATSGAVGPLLVGAAFLALAPRLTGALGPLESAYLIAPYAVLAGLAGSALTVTLGRQAADRRRATAARAKSRPSQSGRSQSGSSPAGFSPAGRPETGSPQTSRRRPPSANPIPRPADAPVTRRSDAPSVPHAETLAEPSGTPAQREPAATQSTARRPGEAPPAPANRKDQASRRPPTDDTRPEPAADPDADTQDLRLPGVAGEPEKSPRRGWFRRRRTEESGPAEMTGTPESIPAQVTQAASTESGSTRPISGQQPADARSPAGRVFEPAQRTGPAPRTVPAPMQPPPQAPSPVQPAPIAPAPISPPMAGQRPSAAAPQTTAPQAAPLTTAPQAAPQSAVPSGARERGSASRDRAGVSVAATTPRATLRSTVAPPPTDPPVAKINPGFTPLKSTTKTPNTPTAAPASTPATPDRTATSQVATPQVATPQVATPARTMPAEPAPAKTTSAEAAPAKATPARATAEKAAPTKAAPVKAAPVSKTPVQEAPTADAAPEEATSPTTATPAKTLPMKATKSTRPAKSASLPTGKSPAPRRPADNPAAPPPADNPGPASPPADNPGPASPPADNPGTTPSPADGPSASSASPAAGPGPSPLWVDDPEATPPPAPKKRRFGRRSDDSD